MSTEQDVQRGFLREDISKLRQKARDDGNLEVEASCNQSFVLMDMGINPQSIDELLNSLRTLR